jgi:hypothetical protein
MLIGNAVCFIALMALVFAFFYDKQRKRGSNKNIPTYSICDIVRNYKSYPKVFFIMYIIFIDFFIVYL